MQRPPVRAGEQAHLLRQGQFRDKGFDVSTHSALSLPSRPTAVAGSLPGEVDVLPQRPEEPETELRVVYPQDEPVLAAHVLTVTVFQLVPQVLYTQPRRVED